MKRCPNLGGDWTLSEVIFDVPQVQRQIQQLEERSAAPDFWSDPNAANKDFRKLSRLRDLLSPFLKLQKAERDISELYEMLKDEPSPEIEKEADAMAIA